LIAAETTVDLSEWRTGGPLEGEHLDPDPAVNALAEDLSRSGRLVVTDHYRAGVCFQATSYVGRVKIGRLLVSIRPKLEAVPLLQLLRYVYGLRDLTMYGAASFGIREQTFVDVLLHQLATEAEEILARGLHRAYQRAHGRLVSPRGRIDMLGVVRASGRPEARVPCTWFPREEDTPLNRVLLAGLRTGCRLTGSVDLRGRLRRIAAQMDGAVSSIRLDQTSLEDAERNSTRLTRAYGPALRLIRILLDGMGMSLDEGGPEVPLPGFLFDMNRFFQALVGRFLRENLVGLSVREEHSLHGVVRYAPGHNPRNRRTPTPRPDFALLREGKVLCLLDAKYRDLWETPLPRDMLYQLALYALGNKQAGPGAGSKRGRAVILYPVVGGENEGTFRPEQRIEILDPTSRLQMAEIVLRSVDLRYLSELVRPRAARLRLRERQAYAGMLALGRSRGAVSRQVAIC